MAGNAAASILRVVPSRTNPLVLDSVASTFAAIDYDTDPKRQRCGQASHSLAIRATSTPASFHPGGRLSAARFLLLAAMRPLGTASRLGDHGGRIDRGCFGDGRGLGPFAGSWAAARPTYLAAIGVFEAAYRLNVVRLRRLDSWSWVGNSAGIGLWHRTQAAGLRDLATSGFRNAAHRLTSGRVFCGHSLGHGLKAEHRRGDERRSGQTSRQHDPDPLVNSKRDWENPHTTDAP